LEKGSPLFHIPLNSVELGFLKGRWARLGISRRRGWRGREYKKVDQKENANKKRP
jgi:hypothetical protein